MENVMIFEWRKFWIYKNTDNKQKWLDVEKDHWRDMRDVSVILSCGTVKEKAEDRVSVGIFHIYRKFKSNGFRFFKNVLWMSINCKITDKLSKAFYKEKF